MEFTLPLFPLELVVYPQSLYPLHIFEERYKKLIQKCRDNGIPFGVVPVVEKQTATVGTVCQIIEIINEYPDGKLDILIRGMKRFNISDSWTHSDGYMIGKVAYFDDKNDESNFMLVNELETRFRKMLAKIDLKLNENFWRNLEKAKQKSFKIAEKSALSIAKQVELLRLQDEELRVEYLIRHIQHFETTVESVSQRLKIVMNDGYIN